MECTQRLSRERLEQWAGLKLGMFIHYGMSTFVQNELPTGREPSTLYAPTALDVDQWMRVARDAGMKYAILTTKHVSGHCLWPSKHTDYSVATSSDTTDVVGAFVSACRKYGIAPGFYYCSWDNHHLFGSETPNSGASNWGDCFATPEYWAFEQAQLEELCTQYGELLEIWIDIPKMLPRAIRHRLYDRLAQLQPGALIVMNHGIGDGSKFDVNYAWPTDLITIERFLPNSHGTFKHERVIEGRNYYLAAEVCDPIGQEWFYVDGDKPRSDAELLGMYLVSTSRGANLLLDVPPDRTGTIPEMYAQALYRLRRNIDAFERGSRG